MAKDDEVRFHRGQRSPFDAWAREALTEPAAGDPRWSRVLLVEGVAGSGKSTLLNALARRYVADAQPVRTFLHLTQAHTYGPLAPAEDAGTLTREQAVTHVADVADRVCWLIDSLTAETKPKLFALVDCLHLTACQRPGAVSFEDLREVDRALARRGVRLLFLRASPETLWDRGIRARRETGFITGYATKFGTSLEEIHAYFVAEQDRMLRDLERSAMEVRVVEVDGPILDYLAQAWDFWVERP